MDTTQIGKFLAQLRKERGMTQEQLGVTNKTISRWENGNYLPPVDMLVLLSERYGVSINEILSGQYLTEEAFCQQAEENLKAVLSGSPSGFTLEERIRYFTEKWKKDHRFARVGIPALLMILMLACAWQGETGWMLVAALTGIVYPVVERNRMMAYVEARAYDGTGSQM